MIIFFLQCQWLF